ncbi:MAG TPA: SDR family oxidoreductase [Ilumatobacter sp.]|nr:SDR family oxidoreductase [Ilumatobacter sp.]
MHDAPSARRPVVAVLTGAGAGIGRAAALRLAADGMTVVVTDRHAGRMSAVVDEIVQAGGVARGYVLDIERREHFTDVFAAVERELGPIGVYVWNAALNVQQPLLSYDPELFDRLVYANLNNCWFSSTLAARQMERAGGGSIVMVGSVAPDTGATAVEAPYGMSKAGVRALVLALAKVGAPLGIRCNEVIMGLVTGTRFVDTQPEKAAAFLPQVPRGVHTDTAEIAEVIAFLAGDRASAVTGEVLNASAGMLLRL